MKRIFLLVTSLVMSFGVFGQIKYLPTADQIEIQAKLAASNYFVDINNRLSQVYTSPEGKDKATEIASVDEFVKLGGASNPGLRVCLRNFEPPTAATKSKDFVDFNILEKLNFNLPINGITVKDNVSNAKQANAGTLCVSVGFIVCVSYGGEVGAFASYKFDPNVTFDQARYKEAKEILVYLKEFASQASFQKVLNEMYALPKNQMNAYVHNNIINTDALAQRGVKIPKDIIVQRSAFADDRPTLFCLTKYRKDGKSKLTITFDATSI